MIINHNISALNTYRQLSINNSATAKNLEKLSSGLRINRAGDDAAGLAISEKMRGQIRGLNMATKNAQDGISLIQTAEGALNETHAILQRMRELAVQSANDTNTEVDRQELQKEIDQLSQELSRIGATTEFNTKKLLDGSFTGIFHIGANEGQNLSLQINDMRGFNLGVAGKVKVEVAGTINDGTVTSDLDFADGTYTVVDDGNGNYNLVDSNGNVVAKSNDGMNFTLNGTDDTLSFTYVVTKVIVSGNGTNATGIMEATNSGLQAGSYTYDDTAKALKDANGKIVATTTDGKQFTSAEDGTTTVFSVSTALTDKASVEVGGIDISSQTAANAAITTINNAIEKVSAERAKLGAYQNRLEHTINNLGTSAENLTAAESRIRDVDMAKEMMEFTKNSILAQAATAMLAQANQVPQGVLQLLR